MNYRSPSSYIANPFSQLYKIEDCIYDNAPVEIKEIISDVSEDHYDYYTEDQLDQLTSRAD